MYESTYLRQSANDAAARAMRSWLIAVGLAAEIAGICEGDAKITPAPGLAKLRTIADRAATQAAATADPAWDLAKSVKEYRAAAMTDPNPEAIKKMRQAEDQLLATRKKVFAFVEEAESATRRLAQLGFGISALHRSTPEIERLDRACVAVLHPPDGHGIAVSLLRDGVSLMARSRDELKVEIAGIVCRLLIDRGTKARFEVPGPKGGWFEFVVEPGDVLAAFSELTSRGSKVSVKHRKTNKAGGSKTQSGLISKWPSPVKVSEPADFAVAKLFDSFGLKRPNQLVVTLERVSNQNMAPDELSSQRPPGLVM